MVLKQFFMIIYFKSVKVNLQTPADSTMLLYNLGQKVLKILHFLSNRTPVPQIWYHSDPSPCPTQVNVVQLGEEMIQPDLNIVFFLGKGKYL